MTPDTSASPRGLHLPVFSFDAIHRPFCASPPTTATIATTWTPAPPSSTPWSSSSSSLSASSSSWSLQPPSRMPDDASTPLPRRGRLVLPALTDPEPPVPAAAAAAVEESADCALLSLVTLSCSTSPAASPVRQPSMTRLLRAASACEKFAELRKKKRKREEEEEDAANHDHHELTGRPPRTDGGLQDGADHGDNEDAEMRRHAGDRAHKRRRVERLSNDMSGSGVEDSTDQAIGGERLQEAQQGTEDSDVEADHYSENETDHSNSKGGDQDDVDSEAAGEDHDDERGLGVLMLGEESANEEEEDDANDEQDALDESRRQHQHQKTVVVMETTSPLPPAAGRRGPRRIWASISARELEGLRLYAPMTGSRRTRVSRMGLHHFFHHAHAASPSTLAS